MTLGIYLNPGNSGYAEIRKSEYVDKTGLIGFINETIGTTKKLTCICRPRRFGKSCAAQMLCAYYDKTCDSRALFSDCVIAGKPSFERHLNQYDVICLDMPHIMREAGKENLIDYIREKVTEEIKQAYPQLVEDSAFSTTLVKAVQITGNRIIAIIDEWDAPIREIPEMEKPYLDFLRTLFKSSATTPKIFAAVYMTGILPIRKDASQSALSNFREYTVLMPGDTAGFFGFTETEVRMLCDRTGRSFDRMKYWYDGYTMGDVQPVYNPYFVMRAAETGRFASYWRTPSAAENLKTFIDMDLKGLQEAIARLIAGESVEVDTDSFRNDMKPLTCRDDVLTLLIHLGYLSYEEVLDFCDGEEEIFTELVRIPNEEIRMEFERAFAKRSMRL